MNRNIFALTLLIILSAAARFIPHGYNFTPIAGMALIGGAYYHKKFFAFLVPLLTLYATDFVLNNTLYRSFFPDQEGIIFFSSFMLYTYVGTAAIVLIGMGLLKKVTAPRLLGSAVFSSILFFLITNFGTWASGMMYPKTGAGLAAAYTAGIPFLSGHLISNIVFSFLLFSAYELIIKRNLSTVSRMHL
ncbi:DUF6580 family putative transport protein [Portibacter lacus]|uniref:Uncharacterized protein n=1 Tax=Portibacter lacus TaxID=1099794 RepID=A0AA37SNF9_9BACT|nr:DUF6580 family putative transport protein [Portibacter lacus]GLR16327.1 hypothetical protein GCM10007940_09420 [Portibacter lacus]